MSSEYVRFLSEEPIAYGTRITIKSAAVENGVNGEIETYAITPTRADHIITISENLGEVDNFIILKCTREGRNHYSHQAIPTHILEEKNKELEDEFLG